MFVGGDQSFAKSTAKVAVMVEKRLSPFPPGGLRRCIGGLRAEKAAERTTLAQDLGGIDLAGEHCATGEVGGAEGAATVTRGANGVVTIDKRMEQGLDGSAL